MAAGDVSAIGWGTGHANLWELGYPLDNVTAWSEPREGSDFAKVSSGEEDSWITGWDYYLEGDARWIEAAATTDPVANGWDAATGADAALQWLRAKNVGRFYPDKDDLGTYHEVYLVEPMRGRPDQEEDGTRRLTIRLRDVNGNPFTGY